MTVHRKRLSLFWIALTLILFHPQTYCISSVGARGPLSGLLFDYLKPVLEGLNYLPGFVGLLLLMLCFDGRKTLLWWLLPVGTLFSGASYLAFLQMGRTADPQQMAINCAALLGPAVALLLARPQLPPPVEGRSRLLQPRPLCAALLVFQAMHLLTYLLYLLHLPMIPGLDYTQPLPPLMTAMLRVSFVLNDLVFWVRPFLVLLFLFVLLKEYLSNPTTKEEVL